jgi:hypothetical protein
MSLIMTLTLASDSQGWGVNAHNVGDMLKFLHTQYQGDIECKCPKDSNFNNYFVRTGWAVRQTSLTAPYSVWSWPGNKSL